MTRPVKTLTVWIFFILTLSVSAQAVQVAFFIEDLSPQSGLEGELTHVAISYKGKWLHSHPSRVSGRLVSHPGVHLTQNLTELGLNFIVFENLNVPDPTDDFYDKFKDMSFNMFAEWNSTTETHCSIIGGKFLKMNPLPMKFKSSVWRLHEAQVKSMRGKPGLSPLDIFKNIEADPAYHVVFESPFSTFKVKARKMKCSALI